MSAESEIYPLEEAAVPLISTFPQNPFKFASLLFVASAHHNK